MPIKAVIFDLDGTITQPYLDFDAIRAEMGFSKEAGPILELMDKMNPERRGAVERILHKHEEKAVSESVLNPGAKETLESLVRAGIHVGILTRNIRANALAIARKHELHFDAVLGREEGPVKPDAFGVIQICRQFGVEPSETILVGDYLFDLLCAKAAGAVAVLLKNHSQADEFAEHADFCIEKISEIIQIINDNEQSDRRDPPQ